MPSQDQILVDLYELLRPFAGEDRSLDPETELVGQLGLNSLKVMDLLMEIEDKYDITVPLNVLPDSLLPNQRLSGCLVSTFIWFTTARYGSGGLPRASVCGVFWGPSTKSS